MIVSHILIVRYSISQTFSIRGPLMTEIFHANFKTTQRTFKGQFCPTKCYIWLKMFWTKLNPWTNRKILADHKLWSADRSLGNTDLI